MRIKITTLDATGEPISVLDLPDQEHVDANTVGVNYVYGSPPPDSYMVGGVWIAKPVQPSANHVWDKSNKVWLDPRTLDDLKTEKWESMKVAREAVFNAPLVTPFGTFDSDETARKNITDTIMLLQNIDAMGMGPASTNFTLYDNSVVSINTLHMVQVGLLLGQKVAQAYARGRVVRDAINAATTTAQVEAVTWD